MNKQEEIREGTQHLFCQHCRAIQKVMGVVAECWYNPLDREAPAFCASNEDFTTQHFKDMGSQGVVIKVGKELPFFNAYKTYTKSEYQDMLLKAGYVATEPLVEVCPQCGIEPHLCKCPTINRGSFAHYLEPVVEE